LGELLQLTGSPITRRFSATESQIPGWNGFHLDSEPDGSTYKPDSLFMGGGQTVRVVHISAADAHGGASRSAYRLHDGLRRAGHESRMYVRNKSTSDRSGAAICSGERPIHVPLQKCAAIVAGAGVESLPRRRPLLNAPISAMIARAFKKEASVQIPESDLLHLHWIAEFLDYRTFFRWLPKELPLVWTLHDMANFTGGCCYDMGCGKFTQQCGACPQLGSKDAHDLTRKVWERKQKYYGLVDAGRFHIVTPSRWLAEEVGRSSLLAAFPRYGDSLWAGYGGVSAAGSPGGAGSSGIPQDAKVVLFVVV